MTDGTAGDSGAGRRVDSLVRTMLESCTRFDGTGGLDDLTAATKAIEAWLAAAPDGDAECAAGLVSRGYQWRMRFKQTGERVYLPPGHRPGRHTSTLEASRQHPSYPQEEELPSSSGMHVSGPLRWRMRHLVTEGAHGMV